MNEKRIPTLIRILFFTVGIILLSGLVLYAGNWYETPMGFTFIGVEINQWIVAAGMVLLGLLGGAMVRSAIVGSYGMD